MTAAELLDQTRARGLKIRGDGEDLVVRPRSRVTPELAAELRAHKRELLDLLSWPPEAAESGCRFGQPHARLFPFLGREVSTPRGRGPLVQVFTGRAAVVINGRAVFFLPDEVRP